MNLNDLHQYGRDDCGHALLNQNSGIRIEAATAPEADAACEQFRTRLAALGLDQYLLAQRSEREGRHIAAFQLGAEQAGAWHAECDTLGLCQRFELDTHANPEDLEREILLAMLLSPVAFVFPSLAELVSALRIRRNIVTNARKTALAFSTEAAERPAEYWTYHEE